MNFEFYKKVLALPLKSTMKGVLRTLAYHCNPDVDNLCIPSWDTIQNESGVSRDVIGESLKVAKEIGIIDYRHRGDIETGKKANEYFFKFEGIKFYKSHGKWKISADTQKQIKESIANAKLIIKKEDRSNGKKPRTAFPDKSRYTTGTINPDSGLIESLKNPDTGLSYTQGLEGYSKSPDTRLINPDSGLEVIETEMLPTRASTQTAIEPCNKKSQKTVWHEKNITLSQTMSMIHKATHLHRKIPPSKVMKNG